MFFLYLNEGCLHHTNCNVTVDYVTIHIYDNLFAQNQI
jgi:hypothetical protein